MNADTVSSVTLLPETCNEVPDDYVFKHHYCLMIHYTGSSLCLSGLVLVRLDSGTRWEDGT